MHLFAVTREPSNSHIFKSLAVHPEARTKFMGYKTFYLLFSVITQSWPGHQTLIIVPGAVHPCYDFHDKVNWGGICPPHTMCPALCYTPPEAQLRDSRQVMLVCQAEAAGPLAQAWLMDKSPPFPASDLTCCQLTPVSKGCPERWGWIVYVAPLPPLQRGYCVAVVPPSRHLCSACI